jgi:hypothetical protein
MTKPPFPSDQQDKFMLRLPEGMRDRIKAVADANNRSMNSEIVATLEEKYPAMSAEITAKVINDLVAYIQAAPTHKDLDDRMVEVNAKIDPEHGQFVQGHGSNGLSQIYFLPASSEAQVLRQLPSGYTREDLARLMSRGNPELSYEEALKLLPEGFPAPTASASSSTPAPAASPPAAPRSAPARRGGPRG